LCTKRQRWGDAPVHSIGAALFAGTDHIHFFREIGYEHPPYTHCPAEKPIWERGRCTCNPENSFGMPICDRPRVGLIANFFLSDYDGYSCMQRWDRMASETRRDDDDENVVVV
jgi:alpha 1,2-mannosyltransferase